LTEDSDSSTPRCEEEFPDEDLLRRVADALVQFYGLPGDREQSIRTKHVNAVMVTDAAWAMRKRSSQLEEPPMMWIRGGRVYDFHGDRGTVAEFEFDLLTRQVEDDAVCRLRRREQGLMPFPFVALPLKERNAEEPPEEAVTLLATEPEEKELVMKATKDVKMVVCLDTLGNNSTIEETKIVQTLELCKALGQCKALTETKQVDSQALVQIDEQKMEEVGEVIAQAKTTAEEELKESADKDPGLQQIRQWAEEKSIPFFTTSAKVGGSNIKFLFHTVAEKCIRINREKALEERGSGGDAGVKLGSSIGRSKGACDC